MVLGADLRVPANFPERQSPSGAPLLKPCSCPALVPAGFGVPWIPSRGVTSQTISVSLKSVLELAQPAGSEPLPPAPLQGGHI